MLRSSREGPTEEKTGRRMPIRLGTALIAATGLLLGPLALATSASAAALPHATTAVMGTYVPVTPFRITDTRTGSGLPNAGTTLTTAAPTLNVQVTGVGTAPVPATASAVVLNVTAVGPQSSGFLTVYPEGTTLPLVSNLNYVAGQNVANLVTTALSATGGVSIYSSGTDVDVVVDVEGYYTSTPSTTGYGLYNSISPVRALGTLAVGAPVAANTSVPVTVTGTVTGVPASAIAVVVNVTAAHGNASSFLSVYPAPALTTAPTFSNVNFAAGAVVCNRVTVAVGTGGVIEVYNHAGTVDVDVDVDGYYTAAGGTGSYYVPITPVRVADTRTASLVGTGTPLAANASESFTLATTASGIPATATSVAANFTVVAGATSGYLSVYPAATTTHPVASSENWVAGDIVPNFTIADTNGTGAVEVYNSYGTINLVVDVFGYFMPFSSGPIMVSAVVAANSITITYNQGASCPAVGADGAFAYDWTGSASGGAVTGCITSATNADELVLSGTFILPGSTGGTLTYTAGAGRTPAVADSTLISVYATSNTSLFSPTQTLALAAAAVPTMVSAVYSTAGPTVVVTYNEDVICPAFGTFTYYWTGAATDAVTGCAPGGLGTDTLTLSLAAADPPSLPASIVYTEPSVSGTPDPAPGTSVYATGTGYVYAISQTLTVWTTPTITAATVSAAAGTIAVTYGEPVACPTTQGSVQADLVYSNVGSPAYPTTCSAAGDILTLGGFMTSATGSTAATLSLPLATDTIVYTVPATNSAVYAVTATINYPQFAAAQTFVIGAATAPEMVSATVSATSIAIIYNAPVTCPATGADADFVYDYQGASLGGTATGCTTSGEILTLAGAFTGAQPSATIVYTEPAAPTASNAVTPTGSTTVFAATQTLGPLEFAAGLNLTAAVGLAPVAGAADTGTLTMNGAPTLAGTFAVTVTGQFASPNGTPAVVPTTVTFTGGVAPVSVTLFDAASQGLVFTVNGYASNTETVFPTAATAAYGEIINSKIPAGTYLDAGTVGGSVPFVSAGGPWTTAQVFTDPTTEGLHTFDLAVQLVDEYGNFVLAGTPTVDVAVAEGTGSTSSLSAGAGTLALVAGYAAFTYTTTAAGTTPDTLSVTDGVVLTSFSLKVRD